MLHIFLNIFNISEIGMYHKIGNDIIIIIGFFFFFSERYNDSRSHVDGLFRFNLKTVPSMVKKPNSLGSFGQDN